MKYPKNTQYLFIDMNAFFASCEQQTNPYYRNKPLVVTPINTSTGCVVAKSYEAKKYGIKTGTLIRDAKKLCPLIIIRESNTFLYLSFHERIINILKSFSPWLSVMSIDEAVIKLSLSEQNSLKSRGLAIKIKQSIQSTLGACMTSSIGIGPNIFLAKQAAEFQKPNGLIEIKLENLKNYYSQIELTDIKGIGFRMKRHLNTLNLFTPLDLYHSSAQKLKMKLGIVGEYWYLKLHGYDFHSSNNNFSNQFSFMPKSIGHSHVLEPKFRSWQLAWSVCQKLIQKVGKRLRSNKLQAKGIRLGVKFLGYGGWHKEIKVQFVSDNFTLASLVSNLWKQIPKSDNLPLKIGVSVFNLVQALGQQKAIFPQNEKRQDLSLTIDKINDRYGGFTIKPANLLPVESSAPERIAFGKPI